MLKHQTLLLLIIITMHITSHTNHILIDIEKTEGVFSINSVELIYIKS